MPTRKVFIFSPIPIFPAIAANQKDILGHVLLFKELGYDITLFCYNRERYPTDFDLNRQNALKYGIKIEFLKRKREQDNIYTYWYQVGPLVNVHAIRTIQSHIESEKPDILLFEYTRFAYLCSLLKKGDAKIIFRVHNFELFHNYDKAKINMGDGLYNWLKMIKRDWRVWLSILFGERLMLKLSDEILCISWGDFELYKRIFLTNKPIYFPLYLGEFTKVDVKDKETLDVIYMGGNFSNNVNRSGGDYLVKKIIPLVNKKHPKKFRFHITGRGAREVYDMKQTENLIVHDFVEDIESLYNKMDIACIPIKAGRGCKIKMLEALKKGVPTIGFRRTFSGIPYIANSFIFAENAKDYVKAFEKLLSVSIRQELSRNSQREVDILTNKERLLSCLRDLGF
ncbi:glycosyltransferase [Candidatus Borrarchaeum sp.]|uniref:glycosyltransferase n=1 Tax=Candidatus Borrarchaeum sp. TaxID=2846742 RepID=UPI00257EFC83|nr:glycosyltransferase [Candidatus Borrarchaeum sp.]